MEWLLTTEPGIWEGGTHDAKQNPLQSREAPWLPRVTHTILTPCAVSSSLDSLMGNSQGSPGLHKQAVLIAIPWREAWGFDPRWGFPCPCDCHPINLQGWIGNEDWCTKLRDWFHGSPQIKSPVINDMLFCYQLKDKGRGASQAETHG